ncbi:hydroxyphenylacetyl-CoA thioesterase PaaI [Halalkalibacterium ligniniphilum]|uniref:hydroxyphenylacetyl-CoA thioesterase PaaI n=1 Tax=Halalkalibacterium ligniniphilum TaxID=1134413 RepID=UPI00034C01E9|nr:hydroxyphenylacetyl-CoA thioesterase PaaI [Halalkalibacterium ligniniphilum]
MEKILEHFKNDTFANLLGMKIQKVEVGYAEVTMNITENMLNFHSTANGGAIFSLADAAFAYASNSHGQTAVGITMTMHYVQASAVGDQLTATATEDTRSKRLGLYRIEVTNQTGKLVALAEGLVYRKEKRF